MNKKRKIAIFTGNRAEYGLVNPVVKALSLQPTIDTYLVVSGSHFSHKFGNTIREIDKKIAKKTIKISVNTPACCDKTGVLRIFSTITRKGAEVLAGLKPDILVLTGDRYETFAMAIAAYYSNIAIAHLFGGDLSQGGHLDDSARHSITKISHLHFVSNRDSYRRIIRLGEEKWRVFPVGLTSLDNVESGQCSEPKKLMADLDLDPKKPIIVFTQHPVTTQSELAGEQAKETLEALKELGHQTVITFPCSDSGADDIIKVIKTYARVPFFRIRKNLGWKDYLGLLKMASVAVGNSSSGIMETPVFKIPCINIGTRQDGRLRARNVIDASYERNDIKKAIEKAIFDRNFRRRVRNCRNPYGTAGASLKIAKMLKSIPVDKKLLQKKSTI